MENELKLEHETVETRELKPAETHHPFGPSSLERRFLCPGSYNVERILKPVEGSEDAKRGSRIHEAAATWIKNMADGKGIDMETSIEGMNLDDNEKSLYMKICQFILDEKERTLTNFNDSDFYPETQIECNDMFDTLYFGTADLIVCGEKRIAIYDWKTGFRKVTHAANNLQGAAYALAASQMYGIDDITVTFFNPNINDCSSHTFNAEEIREVADQITGIISDCMDKNAPCIPGEDQCRYCLGAQCGTCEAYMTRFNSIAKADEKMVPIQEMNDETLCNLYDKCKLFEKFIDGVDKELRRRIEEHGECCGWTIKGVSGGREARDIDGIYAAVSNYYSPEEFMQFCTLSLSKLEGDVTKKMKEDGTCKSQKDAKALLSNLTAPYVSDKPQRKMLTPPKEA